MGRHSISKDRQDKVRHFSAKGLGSSPVSLRERALDGITEYTLDGETYVPIQVPRQLLFTQETNVDSNDRLKLVGYHTLHFETLSDCLSSTAYSIALDDGNFNYTACADLAALQAEIDSIITGDRQTGIKFIVRAQPTFKAGRENEIGFVRIYATEEI